MSFGDDTRKKTAMKPVKKGGDKDQQMGSALRSVYQKTVDEAVPDEMLALLGKLD
ncbi:NepR family anti-sigma factor [Sphingomonas sp. PB2P19]|uniref:NepR family anti-sigma factor n=1 Tax=Sphingomonas rhamnosi TaxID=3096156 RepID=UPI002FC86125